MSLPEVLGDLLDRLEEEGIPHMLVGAHALDAYGVPRQTVDVDLQIRLEGDTPTSAYFLGWFVEERSRDEVFDQDTLILRPPGSPRPFELFVAEHWLPIKALERWETIHSERLDREVPVPSPEDFILLKAAFWLHESRSEAKAAQDGVDIEAVISEVGDSLDRDYLETNARKLGVWSDLARKLA